MTEPTTTPSSGHVLELLRASHERLIATFAELGDERATHPSYDDGWSVADVASHLGSGAEIFRGYLDAGVDGGPAPAGEGNQAIWDAWNAKSPSDQVRDSAAVNAAFLEAVDAMDDDARSAWRMQVFGMDLDLPAFLRMRLGEHALHTWDVAVALDPAATLPEDQATLVSESLGMLAGWTGKATGEPTSVVVSTTEPALRFRLELGPEKVALSPHTNELETNEPTDAGSDEVARLTLPTEAFVRLVYGRLDPAHTPASVSATGVDLDQLRRVFPGV